MITKEQRQAEFDKYVAAYGDGSIAYRMGGGRMEQASADLADIFADLKDPTALYLDVGTGRAEMLRVAMDIGFKGVTGTEVVPRLINGRVRFGECHALPFEDDSFTVVSMFDVIEHLLPGDDEAACRELRRVAQREILVTANNRDSFHGETQLHVNKRDYDQWETLFRQWFKPAKVERLTANQVYVSETWRISIE